MKKVTCQDIANELGISKGLVSLAIRNKYGVSEKMRSKIVLKAIEMGYIFENKVSQDKQKNITLLIKSADILNGEFWREIIKGIESECAKREMTFNIVSWMNVNTRNDVLFRLLENNSQGLIVLNQVEGKMNLEIKKLNIPTIYIDMVSPFEANMDQVMANNFGAGMKAINYLIEKGHRNIILFGNSEYSYSFLQRCYGANKAIKKALSNGLSLDVKYLTSYNKNNLVDEVYQDDESDLCDELSLIKQLKKEKSHVAICSFNDGVLRRVLRIVEELGKRIPDDISIISIDNTSISKSIGRGITSIDIPKDEMGRQAVRIVSEKIDTRSKHTLTVELNTEIIERKSVKDLNL